MVLLVWPQKKPTKQNQTNKRPGRGFVSGEYCISMCVTVHVSVSSNTQHISWNYECLKYVKLRELDLVSMCGQGGNFKKRSNAALVLVIQNLEIFHPH